MHVHGCSYWKDHLYKRCEVSPDAFAVLGDRFRGEIPTIKVVKCPPNSRHRCKWSSCRWLLLFHKISMAADHVIESYQWRLQKAPYVSNRCDPLELRSLQFGFQEIQQDSETGLFFNSLNFLYLLQSSIDGKAVDIFNIIVLHPEMAHRWGGSITNSYVSWMSLLILCLFTRLKI